MPTFSNTATMTYNGITVTSNTVTGEITQVVTAWKTATVDTYRTGDDITYIVGIQNAGTAPFTGLTLTDDLGAYTAGTVNPVPLTFTGDPVLYSANGAEPTELTTVTAGPPLVITGINVPAGGFAQVIYRARVNEFASPITDGEINNTATLTGAGLTEAVTADDTVTANAAANLAITKALSPTTVVENGEITYTFTITNTGEEATAADLVQITDTFNPRLDAPITVTLDGVVLPETGNYTYNPVTGVFSTTAGVITVPAATVTQDVATGAFTVVPGTTVVTVTGTI